MSDSTEIRLFGLIGFPLAQSFSKKYFDNKFRTEHLDDCRFENFGIPSIDDLPELLNKHKQLQGLAVTIPYKQSVIRYLDSTDNIPKGLYACNCIRIRKGLLEGYNTDHLGFNKSFSPLLKPYHTKALVLGNGGAAAAVIHVLKQLGISYSIVSRQLHDNSNYVYGDLNAEIINQHLIIINTTPLGMYPDTSSYPPLPYEFIGKQHFLYDLVYNPALTVFLQKGKERGAIIKNGEDMLALQAEENWKIWR